MTRMCSASADQPNMPSRKSWVVPVANGPLVTNHAGSANHPSISNNSRNSCTALANNPAANKMSRAPVIWKKRRRLSLLPLRYTITPNTADTASPSNPPTTTATPDDEPASAPSRNSTVSNPSRATAAKATKATAVDECDAALSILECSSADIPRAFLRIQKIIQVSTAAAVRAKMPSMACSVFPVKSPTTTWNTTPATMHTSAAAEAPSATGRNIALRPDLARYANTMARTSEISRPSRNVIRKLAPMGRPFSGGRGSFRLPAE